MSAKRLYKVSMSTKKMQVWACTAQGDEVVTCYGQVSGKIQENRYTAEAKNIGRANETTPEEQAQLEVEASYRDQITNKHYCTTTTEARQHADNNREPRKILDYKKGFKKMSKKLLTSRKFNGSRACVMGGKYYSKIGRVEEIKVDHLREAIEKLNTVVQVDFDAELYAHGLPLQRIRSAFLKPVKTDKEILNIAKDRLKALGRKDEMEGMKTFQQAVDFLGYNPNEDAPQLGFYVFDIPMLGVTYEDRLEEMHLLEDTVKDAKLSHLFHFEYPVITHSHKERMKKLIEIVKQGYEGFVHYEPEGLYEFGVRSSNAQKSKPRYDTECKVLDVTEDKSGKGILHCIASDATGGMPVKCKMKVARRDGTSIDNSFASSLDLIGKWITVSYEELSVNSVLTKPVGECIRNCEGDGTPLE